MNTVRDYVESAITKLNKTKKFLIEIIHNTSDLPV